LSPDSPGSYLLQPLWLHSVPALCDLTLCDCTLWVHSGVQRPRNLLSPELIWSTPSTCDLPGPQPFSHPGSSLPATSIGYSPSVTQVRLDIISTSDLPDILSTSALHVTLSVLQAPRYSFSLASIFANGAHDRRLYRHGSSSLIQSNCNASLHPVSCICAQGGANN
jgi:hypothetical protein